MDRSWASSTASLIATPSGTSSAHSSSHTPMPQHVAVHGGHPVQRPVQRRLRRSARRSRRCGWPRRGPGPRRTPGSGCSPSVMPLGEQARAPAARAARPRRARQVPACAPCYARPRCYPASGDAPRTPRCTPRKGAYIRRGRGRLGRSLRVSTLIFSPGGDEQRHLDRRAGLQRGRLGAAGRAVALQAGVGLADHQLDRGGQVHVQRHAVVERDRDHLLLEQVVRGVADDGRRDAGLVVVVTVHEDEVARPRGTGTASRACPRWPRRP